MHHGRATSPPRPRGPRRSSAARRGEDRRRRVRTARCRRTRSDCANSNFSSRVSPGRVALLGRQPEAHAVAPRPSASKLQHDLERLLRCSSSSWNASGACSSGHGVGDQLGQSQPAGDGEVDGGPGRAGSRPSGAAATGETPEIWEQIDLHAVVVELLAQPQPHAVALHEAGDADARAVRDRPDRLVQRAVVAGHLEADVGARGRRSARGSARRRRPRPRRARCRRRARAPGRGATAMPSTADHPGAVEPGQLGDDLPGHAQAEDRDRLADVDVGVQHDVERDRADLGEDADPGIDVRRRACARRPRSAVCTVHGAVPPGAPDPVAERDVRSHVGADLDDLADLLVPPAVDRVREARWRRRRTAGAPRPTACSGRGCCRGRRSARCRRRCRSRGCAMRTSSAPSGGELLLDDLGHAGRGEADHAIT